MSTGCEIAFQIAEIGRSFGRVESFKAYAELSLPTYETPDHKTLLSSLRSFGISIVDCPRKGTRETVDMTLIVDMLSFALPQPQSSVVILVCNDRDYGSALASLRDHLHLVVLVSPASNFTVNLADHMIDWDEIEDNVGATLRHQSPDSASELTMLSDTESVPDIVIDIDNIAGQATPTRHSLEVDPSGASPIRGDSEATFFSGHYRHESFDVDDFAPPRRSPESRERRNPGIDEPAYFSYPLVSPTLAPLRARHVPSPSPKMPAPTEESKKVFAPLIKVLQEAMATGKRQRTQASLLEALGLSAGKEGSKRYVVNRKLIYRPANVDCLTDYLDVAAERHVIAFDPVLVPVDPKDRRVYLNPVLSYRM